MTDNLLPCPFCGERAHMHAVNGPYCGNFECALHLVSGFTLDAWNKRAWQAARTVPEASSEIFASRCPMCSYQHGHQIGCENNPIDIALRAAAPEPKK